MAVSLTVSLAAAEYFLRLTDAVEYRPIHPPIADRVLGRLAYRSSPTPGLSYELVPASSRRWRRWRITTNSYGMRDREPLPDAAGLVRIATVGDSFTFGWGVDASEAYPNALERLLNEEAETDVVYDVLNFGVAGYSSRDEAVVLARKVRPLEPDLVILGYVLNDPEIAPVMPLEAAFAPVEWWQHSHFLRLLAQARWEWDVHRLGVGDYRRYLHAEDERWHSVEVAFESMRRTTEEMDVPMLLVIFPVIPPPQGTWDDYIYEDVHARVAELGRSKGFYVLDLLAAYRRHAPATLGVSRDDRHPNALGHGIAAHRIAHRLHHQLRDAMAAAAL